jgi:hypothetical protein
MARIEEYQIDTNVQATDLLIGTDVGDGNKTKNYRISDILALGGGGTSGVSSIRLLGEANGLNGNVNFEAGAGVTITQSESPVAKLVIGLTGGAQLSSFTAGVLDGSSFTINSTNNDLIFNPLDGISLSTQTGDTINIGQTDSGATAGTYTNASVTVNAKGIVTNISSGTGGTPVEANPTDAATTSLAKLKVDTTTYSIPIATQVQVSAPVNNAGTATAPIIGMAQSDATTNGYLSANDFTTFNNKQTEINLSTNNTSGPATFNPATGALNIPNYATTGGVTSVTATSPVVSSGGTTPVISMLAATTTQAGYLNPSEFNTFNDKQTEITLTTTGSSGPSTFNAATGALNIPVYNVSSGVNTQTGNVTWDSEGYNVSWVDFGLATFTNRQATTGAYQSYETTLTIGEQGYRLSQASNDINLGGSVTWEVVDETKQYGLIERSSINNSTTLFTKDQLGSDTGLIRTFTKASESVRFVEQLHENGVLTKGWFTNSDLQRWFGGKTDTFDADVVQGYYPPAGYGTIQLPQTPNTDETNIATSATDSGGKIWSNFDTGEISYVDRTKSAGKRIRRLASYRQKAYSVVPANSPTIPMDFETAHNFSYSNTNASPTVSLTFSNMENGDYGNLLVDLTSATGTFNLVTPAGLKVANGGGGAISLAVGQIHTITVTQAGSTIYATVANNYT